MSPYVLLKQQLVAIQAPMQECIGSERRGMLSGIDGVPLECVRYIPPKLRLQRWHAPCLHSSTITACQTLYEAMVNQAAVNSTMVILRMFTFYNAGQ